MHLIFNGAYVRVTQSFRLHWFAAICWNGKTPFSDSNINIQIPEPIWCVYIFYSLFLNQNSVILLTWYIKCAFSTIYFDRFSFGTLLRNYTYLKRTPGFRATLTQSQTFHMISVWKQTECVSSEIRTGNKDTT